MHHGFIKSLRHIVEEAGFPKASIVEEARGLRVGDATRPGDLVVLDFTELGRHHILDGVVTTVCMNSFMSRVEVVPGLAAKKVEGTKFKAGQISAHPVSSVHEGRHTFVPFAIEDGGRIGAHGQDVLRMLVEHVVARGKLPPRPRNAAPPHPLLRFPCGSAGGNNDYPHGCTSPCPARLCGTLRPLSQRKRATPRLPMRKYPLIVRDSSVLDHVIRSNSLK